ncbi:MAG: HAD-IB family hydrolase [Thauera sp.]|nr:HAD-IB family hydrolase [Thauera sp.]
MAAERELALFDLDFTLIPFDSGMQWVRFLIAEGALEPGLDEAYLALCMRYVAGQGDAATLHRFVLRSLMGLSAEEASQWQARFALSLAGQLPAGALEVVASHQRAGHLCCIVTATTRSIARPFADAFGVEHLIASEAARSADGRFSGEIEGALCHGAAKLDRVRQWLERRGECLGDFARTHFYSDSASDLPLLAAVSHPVAVSPDAGLRARAEVLGWPTLAQLRPEGWPTRHPA